MRSLFYSFSLAMTTLCFFCVDLELLGAQASSSAVLAQSITTQQRIAEANQLLEQGIQQNERREFQSALSSLQQALEIYREVSVRRAFPEQGQLGEGRALGNIGRTYDDMEQYQKAIEFYEPALAIFHEIGDRNKEVLTLKYLGSAYEELEKYELAIEAYNRLLLIMRETGDRAGEGNALYVLGEASAHLIEFSEALNYYQQALEIFQAIGDRTAESATLIATGSDVLTNLGQYSKAIDYYKQAVAIAQDLQNLSLIELAYNEMGLAYRNLKQYSQALEAFEGSSRLLKFSRSYADEISWLREYATVLSNIGRTLDDLGRYEEALDMSLSALRMRQQVGDRGGEATTLNSIGTIYKHLNDHDRSLKYYQQSLAIRVELNHRDGQAITLENIAKLFEEQDQAELAIIFYKQSINVTENVRRTLSDLPQEYQQSYTDVVANAYRHLADLLLQQNRVLEAQRVLDLLKVQELDNYLRGVQRNAETESGITLRPAEQEILLLFNQNQGQLIELGRELTRLSAIPVADRTPAETSRIIQLRQLQELSRQSFGEFLQTPEIQNLIAQLRQTTEAANLDLAQLNDLRDNLQRLNQNAVILYPLILDDRLELVLVTADAPPIRRTVAVRREDLNRAIAEFRSVLQSPSSNAISSAKQLYDWLIRPLEADLAQANAQTILYAPDGQLRYIPLAALHDDSQWLVQRFRINNITAASLDDLTQRPVQTPTVLAGAFTQGHYDVTIGDRTFSFGGLQFAAAEVARLSQFIPDTVQHLDRNFNSSIVYEMDDYRIVHLATHATFNPGPPENSFILFGDGEHANLTDVKSWTFPNVDLIVLSACETAVGDVPLGNGAEILGFGYLMQQAGADASIASLWSVNDGGTQALMNAFYAALSQGKPKAEALRQAQIALITDRYEALENSPRGFIDIRQRIREDVSAEVVSRLEHPYYWAPFILIGDGL